MIFEEQNVLLFYQKRHILRNKNLKKEKANCHYQIQKKKKTSYYFDTSTKTSSDNTNSEITKHAKVLKVIFYLNYYGLSLLDPNVLSKLVLKFISKT